MNTFEQIRRTLRLSMNGIAAQTIKQAYPDYQLVYGVDLVRIKEIVAGFTPDNNLASELWETSCREEMIAATMLFVPREDTKHTIANHVSATATTDELRLQLARNFLKHINDEGLLRLWITKGNDNQKLCALTVAPLLSSQISIDIENDLWNFATTVSGEANLSTARVIVHFFDFLLRRDPDKWKRPILERSTGNPLLEQEIKTLLDYGC